MPRTTTKFETAFLMEVYAAGTSGYTRVPRDTKARDYHHRMAGCRMVNLGFLAFDGTKYKLTVEGLMVLHQRNLLAQ